MADIGLELGYVAKKLYLNKICALNLTPATIMPHLDNAFKEKKKKFKKDLQCTYFQVLPNLSCCIFSSNSYMI